MDRNQKREREEKKIVREAADGQQASGTNQRQEIGRASCRERV